jgi:hypothetical protein
MKLILSAAFILFPTLSFAAEPPPSGSQLINTLCAVNSQDTSASVCVSELNRVQPDLAKESDLAIVRRICSAELNPPKEEAYANEIRKKFPQSSARTITSMGSRYCWQKATQLFGVDASKCEADLKKARFEAQKLEGVERLRQVTTIVRQYNTCVMALLNLPEPQSRPKSHPPAPAKAPSETQTID